MEACGSAAAFPSVRSAMNGFVRTRYVSRKNRTSSPAEIDFLMLDILPQRLFERVGMSQMDIKTNVDGRLELSSFHVPLIA